MAKNIVFCADGTWNGPDDSGGALPGRTNVYKLFANLDGAPAADPTLCEQERTVTNAGGKQVQIAKYLNGVGNSDNPLVRFLGGTVGAGLIARIVRGYTFLSRNYLAGDRIYINGFSRGAYTARALAGLISARGLLDATAVDPTDKDHAYSLGLAVWYDYRRQLNGGSGFLGALRGVLDGVALTYVGHATDKLISHVPIEAVAVWDTVGSLGIPLYDHGATLDFFQFTNARLPPAVRTGLHAVAIDERRETFTPSLWDPDPRVTQVLFAGAHADVGGGYDDDVGLSDGSFNWLAGKLNALDLLFSQSPPYISKPNGAGRAHCPWLRQPWPGLGISGRVFPNTIRVSQSALDRRAGQPVPVEGSADPIHYVPDNNHCFIQGFEFSPDQIEP